MEINFHQAVESMGEGIAVKSMVSKTIYEMSKEGLKAEGKVVPLDYMTVEEANGTFIEVNVIEKEEDVRKLSNEQVDKILSDVYEQVQFNEKHGR